MLADHNGPFKVAISFSLFKDSQIQWQLLKQHCNSIPFMGIFFSDYSKSHSLRQADVYKRIIFGLLMAFSHISRILNAQARRKTEILILNRSDFKLIREGE